MSSALCGNYLKLALNLSYYRLWKIRERTRLWGSENLKIKVFWTSNFNYENVKLVDDTLDIGKLPKVGVEPFLLPSGETNWSYRIMKVRKFRICDCPPQTAVKSAWISWLTCGCNDRRVQLQSLTQHVTSALKVLATISDFKLHFFPHLLIFLHI